MRKSLGEMTDEERARLFPVILSEYNPEWRNIFISERAVVKEAVGSQNIIRISHIGSTAVPGLISKPTIDILVEIKDATSTPWLISNMQMEGYIYRREPENPPPHMLFVKGYTPEGFRGQAFHVHVRYGGDWPELCFRDYLLTHPETAEEYGRLKLELKEKYEHDRNAYTDAKTDFITRVMALARAKVSGKS